CRPRSKQGSRASAAISRVVEGMFGSRRPELPSRRLIPGQIPLFESSKEALWARRPTPSVTARARFGCRARQSIELDRRIRGTKRDDLASAPLCEQRSHRRCHDAVIRWAGRDWRPRRLQRPGLAEAARWGMTESEIACLELSRTDRAATAEMAAPAMMYIAGTLRLPVRSISS